MKKLLLILNPCSGKKKASHALADVVNVFNRGGYDVTVYITAARGDATKVVAQRAPEFDLVVCAGGDGTFNETISGLLAGGHDTPIGYLPAGSTNDFASSLHLSKNLVEAARDIVEGTPRRLDVGRFNDRYFSYVASFGAFTDSSYATPQKLKNRLGYGAYVLGGAKGLFRLQNYRMTVECNGETFTDDFVFGGVSNCVEVGGIIRFPDGTVQVGDGRYEVVLVRRRDYADCPEVFYTQTDRIRLTADKALPWTIDGEYKGDIAQADIEILPAALQLVW